MDRPFVFLAVLLTLSAACSGNDGSPSTPISPSSPTVSPSTTPALSLEGDPESQQGATWTYRGTLGGVAFDLQGILLKPRGAGPFPAVVISHGSGGSAVAYSRGVGVEMVQWGLVCIATNYTHAGGVEIGAPGSAAAPDTGASQPNILRAHAAYEILRTLGYVDMSRVAAHGVERARTALRDLRRPTARFGRFVRRTRCTTVTAIPSSRLHWPSGSTAFCRAWV